MTEGMCFGDKALEGDENTRAATVRASGPLTCARLSAEDCPCPSPFGVAGTCADSGLVADHACIDRVANLAAASPRAHSYRSESDMTKATKHAGDFPCATTLRRAHDAQR